MAARSAVRQWLTAWWFFVAWAATLSVGLAALTAYLWRHDFSSGDVLAYDGLFLTVAVVMLTTLALKFARDTVREAAAATLATEELVRRIEASLFVQFDLDLVSRAERALDALIGMETATAMQTNVWQRHHAVFIAAIACLNAARLPHCARIAAGQYGNVPNVSAQALDELLHYIREVTEHLKAHLPDDERQSA